jgi:hypothetical protein
VNILGPQQLDNLQLSSTGEHLSPETLGYILDHYSTNKVKEKDKGKDKMEVDSGGETVGLTLEGEFFFCCCCIFSLSK